MIVDFYIGIDDAIIAGQTIKKPDGVSVSQWQEFFENLDVNVQEEIDEMQEEIYEMQEEIDELIKENLRLERVIDGLGKELKEVEERIYELENGQR